MIVLRIVATMADVFILLISALSLVGNRLTENEKRIMLFLLLTTVANIVSLWSGYVGI